MYLVIRCPGCRTFTYVDRYQKWRLCPSCGESINCARVPVYIEVNSHADAENMVLQLERYMHKTKRSDLSPEELGRLRVKYAEWIRAQEH